MITAVPRLRARWLALGLIACALVGALAAPRALDALTLQLPPGMPSKVAYDMYAEQLDAQESIAGLVDGDIAAFAVSKRIVNGSNAELQLDVRYRNGLVRKATMRLVKANNVWFVRTITRGSGTTEIVPSVANPDIGVINTILAEQIQSSSVGTKFVNGTYTNVVLGRPRAGYRSTELPVTFSGGKRVKKKAGTVTCISKTAAGTPAWFITGFTE